MCGECGRTNGPRARLWGARKILPHRPPACQEKNRKNLRKNTQIPKLYFVYFAYCNPVYFVLYFNQKKGKEEKKMTISKIFTEVNVSNDCEARDWSWETSKTTYSEAVADLKAKWDAWFRGVRLVEKTFDSDTFEITTRVIKETKRTYKDFCWDGVKETIF